MHTPQKSFQEAMLKGGHQKPLWRRFNGDSIQLPIKDAVEHAIRKESESGFKLKVCIGTDSQVKGQETEFATVIVFPARRAGWFHVHPQRKNHPQVFYQRKNAGGSCQKYRDRI